MCCFPNQMCIKLHDKKYLAEVGFEPTLTVHTADDLQNNVLSPPFYQMRHWGTHFSVSQTN